MCDGRGLGVNICIELLCYGICLEIIHSGNLIFQRNNNVTCGSGIPRRGVRMATPKLKGVGEGANLIFDQFFFTKMNRKEKKMDRAVNGYNAPEKRTAKFRSQMLQSGY